MYFVLPHLQLARISRDCRRTLHYIPVRQHRVLAYCPKNTCAGGHKRLLVQFRQQTKELVLPLPKLVTMWVTSMGSCSMFCVASSELLDKALCSTRAFVSTVLCRPFLLTCHQLTETRRQPPHASRPVPSHCSEDSICQLAQGVPSSRADLTILGLYHAKNFGSFVCGGCQS